METRRLVYVLTGIGVALIVVLGGLSIALLATGGGDDSDSGDGAAQNGDNGSNTEPTPDLPERVEGELRLVGSDPITLDPACASDAGSAEYIVEVFSGLVSFDKDLNIIPDIAERWEVSPDGTVYTFTLRTNVVFHDGSRRIVADDFKFSMERALNPDTLSTVGPAYLDDIVGAREYARGQVQEVSGIRAVNDNTLEITIDSPKEFFLSKLTYPTSFAVDRRQVGDSTCFAGADWTLNPNGTGPFEMKEFVLGQRIVLEPNPDYYLEPKPSLQQVTYVLSGGSSLVMYENDEIDLTGVGINDIERIRDPNEPLNEEFHESEQLDTFYIGFNLEEPPFDDVRVRQALAMSIDKEAIASSILIDLVTPAKGVLPPGMPGYNEGLEGLPYDPDEARRLLDEAGGPQVLDGATILAPGTGASPGPVLDAIVALWEQELGVVIEIEQEETGIFFRDIKEGNFQIASQGWIADYNDPHNFLDLQFHSQSPLNDTKYSNAEVDRLLEQARAETSEEARLELYQQAEEIIVQDAAWIPLSHSKASVLVKPYVQGYVIPPFVIPNLRYVSISR